MTNVEIANSFELWAELVDPQATMTETEFNAMEETEKLQIIEDCFGNS